MGRTKLGSSKEAKMHTRGLIRSIQAAGMAMGLALLTALLLSGRAQALFHISWIDEVISSVAELGGLLGVDIPAGG